MRKIVFSLAAVTIALGSLFVSPGSAQAVDAEWAQHFVGSWDVTLQTPDGAVPTVVTVREEAGKLTVELGRGGQQGRQITDVERSGEVLVAKYAMEYQGMSLPATLSLERSVSGLSTEWNFGGGMYTTRHEATKR